MDYLIDLDAINTYNSKLEQTKGNITRIVDSIGSNYLSTISGSEISSAINKAKNSIERLKTAVNNTHTWFNNYKTEINTTETNLSSFNVPNGISLTEFKGEFIDLFGRITMPAIKTNGDPLINYVEYPDNSNLVSFTYNGKDFFVVNTKIPIADYEQYIKSNKMYQDAGLLGGQCMILSQYYAVDLLRGTYTKKSDMADLKGGPATRINEPCVSSDYNVVANYVFNEIMEGNPVVLQVTQKHSDQGKRHLVTVVGFTSDVRSAADMNPDNILVLDCYDGRIQTLSERNRRFFAQGGTYLAYGPTEKFKTKEVNT
jgi:hypothetical protein